MATLTLTYTGTVTAEGAIKLPKRLRPEVVKAFAGKSIEVTFRRVRNYRSSEQNRYYWGVVVPLVCEGFRDAGNDLQSSNPEHLQLIHDYLKAGSYRPVPLRMPTGNSIAYRQQQPR